MVYQYFQTDIPKVFCRNPLQQVDTALLRLFGTKAGHEIADNLVVAAGSYQYSGNRILIQLVPAGKSTRRILRHKRCRIGIADRIFLRQPSVVLRTLFRGYLRQIGYFRRRYDIHIYGKCVTFLFIKFHRQFRLFAERKSGKAEMSVFRCPHQHIPFTGRQPANAAGRGVFGSYRIKFRIIV